MRNTFGAFPDGAHDPRAETMSINVIPWVVADLFKVSALAARPLWKFGLIEANSRRGTVRDARAAYRAR